MCKCWCQSFDLEYVDDCDVVQAILSIKSNAVGFDEINTAFLKIILPKILPHLTYLINSILTACVFPINWKVAKVIPVHKVNNDFRPIAILPYLSKVVEHILHMQISSYVYDNGLITDRQSGFRPKRICTTALLDVTEYIRSQIDENNIGFLTLLDHSKAFDTVDYSLLCGKLSNLFNFQAEQRA